MTAFEAFTSGAIEARATAAKCLDEAKAAQPERAKYLIKEHQRHIERAEDYEMRAAWYAPKTKLEIAA